VARPRHGYQVLYQALAPGQGAPVGCVMRLTEDDGRPAGFSQLLLSQIQHAASGHGWSVLTVDYLNLTAVKIVEDLTTARAWGAIIDSYNPEIIRLARKAGITVVAVDAWHSELGVDSVVQDGFNGGVLAARYLVDRGHQRIAWLGTTSDTVHSMSRFGGALTALRRGGVLLADDRVIELQAIDARERTRELLARPDRPTGVLALWRDHTVNVAAVARELGLTIGRDLDLVGWCAEEQYDRDVVPFFNGGMVPPMIVWSMQTMAEIATVRLAERHAKPDLPPVRMNIETRLRIP